MYCKREQDAVSITSHVNPQNDIINVINYLTVMTKEDMQLFHWVLKIFSFYFLQVCQLPMLYNLS